MAKKMAQAETYSNIRAQPGAIHVKLCDRIANIENSISHDRVGRRPGRIFRKYLDNWEGFQDGLRERCRGEGAQGAILWRHLDSLMEEGATNLIEEA